jgi:hypothetical protein
MNEDAVTDQPPPSALEPTAAPEPRVRSRTGVRTRAALDQHASTPGRRREIWICLPHGLVAEIDDAAAAMGRSRARVIEQLLRLGLEVYHQRRGETA